MSNNGNSTGLSFRQRTTFRRRGIDLSLLGGQKYNPDSIKKDADGLPNIDAFWEAFDEDPQQESFIHVIKTPMQPRSFIYQSESDEDEDDNESDKAASGSIKENVKVSANLSLTPLKSSKNEAFKLGSDSVDETAVAPKSAKLTDADWDDGFKVLEDESNDVNEKVNDDQDDADMVDAAVAPPSSEEPADDGFQYQYYDNGYGDDIIEEDGPGTYFNDDDEAPLAAAADNDDNEDFSEQVSFEVSKKPARKSKGRKKRISFVMTENDDNDKDDVDAVFKEHGHEEEDEDEEDGEGDYQEAEYMDEDGNADEDAEDMDEVTPVNAKNHQHKKKSTKAKAGLKERLVNSMEQPEGEKAVMNVSRHGRNIIRPLAFWKNEKVVYSRGGIKSYIVNDADSPMVKKKTRPQKTLHRKGYNEKCNILEIPVVDVETKEEEIKAIAFTKETKDLRKASADLELKVQTNFSEGDFMTSGILVFPPKAEKPTKSSGKYSMVFYVITGVFEVTLHESTFVINTGGQFMIPRGNQYRIRNLGNRECRLFYSHCKGPQIK